MGRCAAFTQTCRCCTLSRATLKFHSKAPKQNTSSSWVPARRRKSESSTASSSTYAAFLRPRPEASKMPELPEVETIVRGLARKIVGKTIAGAEVRLARIAVAAPTVDFAAEITGERIVGVRRRGKYAVFELASGSSIVT